MAEITEKLTATPEQRKYLLESTTEQSDSTAWHEMRLGWITASRVHAVLHTNQDKPAPSVVKGICTPSMDIGHLTSIKWGKENEEKAVTAYTEHHRSIQMQT